MTTHPTPAPRTTADLRWLLKIVRAAQRTWVGQHWPGIEAMRRDGIGFGLNDGEHEDRIRKFLYECQPEFLMQHLEAALVAIEAEAASPPAEAVEALRAALATHQPLDKNDCDWDAGSHWMACTCGWDNHDDPDIDWREHVLLALP